MNGFIQQALVFIGASVILVPIFHRLGFGSVLGYLIAGILVGPSGLKFINHPESVLHFAELGIVILLFMIGLEIQPKKLWSMRKHLVGFGGLQVLVTTMIFMVIGLGMGFDALTAGVIAFGLSLSSTAFALQTLMEKNQFNTEFGRGSFSILLMQDMLAIPALAIIPSLGTQPGAASINLGAVAIFIPGFLILAFLANRFLIRPLFKIVAATKAREIFTAATLFIVFGVAAIMLQFGLSAALGTFIAGVLLADSEYRHELEANLDPFKSLLMGLFFIAVGMGVSLNLIFEKPLLTFGLSLLYLAVKFLVIYGTGRLFKMNHENSKLMGLTVAQGGEFAFVIFGIVQQSGVIASETLSMLTVIITLSMALNPLLGQLSSYVARRWQKPIVEPRYDSIKDESPEVIIAGFGRFGQIFGRVLRSQAIPFVAIDHDADQIDLLRKFNSKVYYGDAGRLDILEAAGAAKAKYFILAIDDLETSVKAAKTIREHFPHLKIFARARNRGHAFDFIDLGITHIKRETFDSSVNFVGELLVDMGKSQEKVMQLIAKFKDHDEIMLQEQFKVREDDKQYVSISNQSLAQLTQVLNEESHQSFIQTSKT